MASEENIADELEHVEVEAETQAIDESKSAPSDRANKGPFDVAEAPAMRPYIDLGAIKVAPRQGLGVRLDVDEKSKRIVAVSLDYKGSTLQVQAFSSPKSTGLWNAIRAQLLDTFTRAGAPVQELDGNLGPELRLAPKPGTESKPMRFVGVDGPRWTLRGAIVGEAASGGQIGDEVEEIFRELVVVRGSAPLPPRELLPLRLPEGVQNSQQGEQSATEA